MILHRNLITANQPSGSIKTRRQDAKFLPSGSVRRLGGKPVKTEGDVDAVAKERPEEAPFAALRTYYYRLRTCSRAPAAKPTRPNNHLKNNEIICLFRNNRGKFQNWQFL